MFEQHLEANVEKLSKQLQDGSFVPHAVRREWISKGPGGKQKRPLGIPVVRDRVVQGALRNVLEPIFEQGFAEHSYGFRPKRGAKDALRRVDQLLKAGHHWVVDADLKSYFDTIPHEPLLERVKAKVADGRVLDLIAAYLKQQVMESAKSWTPGEGTPQGAVLSPLLANIYLDPLDHLMQEAGTEMVRYADDFVILCRSEAEARAAYECVRRWVEQAGLTLHPEKTQIVDATQKGGFDFLGYHFERGKQWPRQKSLRKFKDTVRVCTRRNHGHSLTVIINRLNEVLRGWFEYFKHSRPWIFTRLDKWIRGRLRSILRRRQHKRGRGRGSDHQRWPNAYFAEQGLFSLATAHADACQSSRR
jgi:RNA-directed DNA polymerase